MANPFTYLSCTRPTRRARRAFTPSSSDGKTKDTPVPGLGTYTEIDPQEGAWLAYIRVSKIDETVARAQKLGATVITPRTDIKEGSFAVLQDPAGARIGVFQKAE